MFPNLGFKFFLLKEKFIVTSQGKISRYKENKANTHIHFSATKEHITPAI